MVTGKLQISVASKVAVSSIGTLVGSIAAAGCARTPVVHSASKLSRARSLNLRIILLLPSSLAFPGTGLHRARPPRIESFSVAPWRSAPDHCGLAVPSAERHAARAVAAPDGISHRLPPRRTTCRPGKIDLQQTTVMKQQPPGKTWQL